VIVADTNLIAYLLITGDHTEAAEAVIEKDSAWCAPVLWRSEFRNILALYLRQGELDLAAAVRLMGEAESLLAAGEFDVASDAVLQLAARSRRSAYDCEFVSLALQLQVPLVTSDRGVLAAFPEIAVAPEEFARGDGAT
jgi:predicted nucleic acid-binding protein